MAFLPGKCQLTFILRVNRKTARELSDLTGISESAISDYANNRKKMTLGTAKTLAEALQIPIDDLYMWEKSVPQKKKSWKKPE
jgi:transcriptional regulator with XRE-family HTH domain